jgi:hypothetical protein
MSEILAVALSIGTGIAAVIAMLLGIALKKKQTNVINVDIPKEPDLNEDHTVTPEEKEKIHEEIQTASRDSLLDMWRRKYKRSK